MRKLTNEETKKVLEAMKNDELLDTLVKGMINGGIDWDIAFYKAAKAIKVISE